MSSKMRFVSKIKRLSIITIFLVFASTMILGVSQNIQSANSNNDIELTTSTDPIGSVLQPDAVIVTEGERISNTGTNSCHTRIMYNPITEKLGVSWVDILNPDTSPTSSIYFATGNESVAWSTPMIIETVLDALPTGYNPTPDKNGSVHFIFEEDTTGDYELQEIIVEDDLTLGSKTAFTANAGDDQYPVTVVDSNGILHLVWRDTTANALGDLYYTNYNATSDLWDTPITRITIGAEVAAGTQLGLTIDNNDTLHLIWSDTRSSDQELYYSFFEKGSAWSSEEKITNVAYAPIDPVITYNNYTKKIEVLFRDNGTTDNLYFISALAQSTAGSWSTPTSIHSYLGGESDYGIVADQKGNTLVVFESDISGISSIYLKQKNPTNNWETEKRISSTSNLARDPSITIDELGNYYIAYTERYQLTTEAYIIYGLIDTDGDGLSDLDEAFYGTNPNNADSDGDTISDSNEILVYGTDPLDTDTDSDLLPDDYEIIQNLNPTNSSDATTDPDNDDLTNLEEYDEGTNPHLFDTDGDNLSDGEEVNEYFTDPLEVDTDGDTLSDGYEVQWGLDPLVLDDVNLDPDDDGLTTEFESRIWTDPTNPDTDGDGYNDGIEVNYGTDPLDASSFPPSSAPPIDYGRIMLIVLISAATIALILTISFLIARQFRPKKSDKRKELEREESQLFTGETAKGREMSWEKIEREKIESAAKQRFDDVISSSDEDSDTLILTEEDLATEPEEVAVTQPKEPIVEVTPTIDLPKKREEKDPADLEKKKEEIKKIITILMGYEKQLDEMLNKKMTPHTLSTASREGLTEFATEAQTLFTEAKGIWNTSILPLIKGFEEQLYVDTLEAERIIDSCQKFSLKILDVLVEREMEFTKEEDKKESVKDIARKALEKSEKEEKEEE